MCCVFIALDLLIKCCIYFVLREEQKKINKKKALLKLYNFYIFLSLKVTKTKRVTFLITKKEAFFFFNVTGKLSSYIRDLQLCTNKFCYNVRLKWKKINIEQSAFHIQ